MCVCGRNPVTVKYQRRFMVTCPATTHCAMRSTWETNEQAAIKNWNTQVKSARHERSK